MAAIHSASEEPPARELLDRTAPSRVDGRYHALLQQLRVSTSLSLRGDALAIGVTSTLTGEGVSTVAANFAVAAAEWNAGPVLLVDANAQKPSIGRTFRVDSEVGLRDVLRGDRPTNDGITRSPIENLSLMLNGQATVSEVMIFNDSAISELVDNLRRSFRWIFFDLPPADEQSTCLALASRLDGVVLVVEAERVDSDAARRACDRLRRAEAILLGAICNKVTSSRHTG